MNIVSHLFFTVLLIATIYLFVKNVKKTWQKFKIGQGKEENRSDQTDVRIKGVLVKGLLQGKMFKEKSAGIMHFCIFWGFVLVSIGSLDTILYGISGFSFKDIFGDGALFSSYLFSQDFANTVALLAIIYAVSRRLFFPPPRLAGLAPASKKDAYIVLSLIGALLFTELLVLGGKTAVGAESALPQAPLMVSTGVSQLFGRLFGIESPDGWEGFTSVVWWLHSFVFLGFVTFLPYSKHQHLIWVWPNMFFRSLKSRGRIRTMEFDENAETFGVGKVSDFTWKQLLDGTTCVECGRCTAQCPAFNTGKKLDPRLMIHHLKDANNEALLQPAEPRALIGGIVSAEELWACTTCGACMEACPLEIEHIPAIIDMRRYLTLTASEFPELLNTTFANLENQSNPWGIDNNSRGDWAKGLDIPTMAQNKDVEYLFWVGCAGSFDDRYKKVSVAIAKIMKQAGIKFSILGAEEKCNGDTARRLGNEYLAQMQIQENIETFQRYQVKKVVTGCPHCFNTLKNEYPDLGCNLEVLHHSDLINSLVQENKITLNKETAQSLDITYHDSCYLGRHNDIYDSPRTLAGAAGTLKEMPRSKQTGFCCGAGGGRMWLEEDEGTRVNENRAKEAIETGANMIATACPFCMTMMNDGVKAHGKEKDVIVKDIAELIADKI